VYRVVVITTITPIAVRELRIRNLRCHQEYIWRCGEGLNLLLGPNGSGKTTLLEAVYLMAHGRSFRQAKDPDLVSHAATMFQLNGSWQRYGPMQIQVAGKRGNVSLRLQGRDVQRRKDVTESFPVLVESPQGRKVVDGATGERRRWLDSLLMMMSPRLAAHYERYLRAVMQRARLLRKRASQAELEAWEYQIVQHGMPIVHAREKLVMEINEILAEEKNLTESQLRISLTSSTEYKQQAWIDRLQRKRNDDLRSGGMRYGPHCDAIAMTCEGREIRSTGSRGQQKLAAIALKMAECALWERYRGLIPVLLLDDCLEALDISRQERLLRRLMASKGQVLMTAPAAGALPQDVRIEMTELTERKPAGTGISGVMEEAA